MLCENCGKEAQPGDTFCRKCGSSLAGEPAPGEQAGLMPKGATPWEPGEGAAPEAGEKAPPAAGEPTAAPLMPPTAPPPPLPPPPAPRAKGGGTSVWAVVSLILGVLSFMCIPFLGGVLAIVFGAIAKSRIKRSKGKLGGSGLATAGLVLGIVNLSILIVIAAIMVPWTLVNIGETRTITRTVAVQGAERVTAELDMRSGSMNVEGGADDLFEGTFTYNIKRWEPEIDYSINRGQGLLTVKQGGGWWIPTFWFIRNDWEIKLKNSVPLDLVATISSGDSTFDLKSLSLLSLDINSSSGSVNADLSGDLPDLRRVSIDQSSGNTNLDMTGKYQTYIQMDVESSSGNINLNLLGEWEGAVDANIRNSSGNVTLHLPEEVGVRVRARTRSGNVNASGMDIDTEDGDGTVYVNDAFRDALITLQIDIEVSSGNVNLVVGE